MICKFIIGRHGLVCVSEHATYNADGRRGILPRIRFSAKAGDRLRMTIFKTFSTALF